MNLNSTPVTTDFDIEALEDGLIFRLTRPAKLNAITKQILLGLNACIDRMEASGQRVLIITGQGAKAFCAGTDLAETSALPAHERQAKTVMARELLVRLSRSRLLSIAAINGLAFGGGLELAMACAFRVASPGASFSLPEIKLGLLPAYGGTQFLPPLVGKSRASELMLTGKVLQCDEALAIGLINRRAVSGDPVPEALAMAREISGFSPLAIDAILHCVAAAGESVTDEGLAAEDRAVRQVFNSADAREGIAAFLEKRPAVFSGH